MKRVLFVVCNHRAGRPQMSAAFWREHGPSDIRAESAGTYPAEAMWPEVVGAMGEVGVDRAEELPRKRSPDVRLRADSCEALTAI